MIAPITAWAGERWRVGCGWPLRFWMVHLGLPLLLGLWLWLGYPATGLDDLIVGAYFDPVARNFPLQNQALLATGLHSGTRLVMILIGVAMLGIWLASFIDLRWRGQRRRAGWIFLAMLVSTSVVSLLKSHSIHHCPWDIVDYGGYAPRLSLFDALPSGIAPGRCFPAGHASGGFALMAFYFGWRDRWPRRARLALWLGLAAGWAMGWTQTMRGAHFPSHTLWAAWVVWLTLLALYCIFPPTVGKA
ncbi:phosphatase PAP2 family protein [Chitiniphilus eburneus]|uniref:Phosphatase PAP2 family protein n=1 Tax=Chitiniphilus eburneus TaxID=2571148 RepID=A0A4U0QDV7_9NEIS|nr:phosphatase PAP2 family protein [Chitiniphilus eburneus]TJZ78812.1 phosphatase PAP2 family protein [Chitiniphilus eburneus]